MSDAGEIDHSNDCVVLTVDTIEGCPMAEIPLAELFDAPSSTLRDTYHDIIRDTVALQLEDTPWLRRADDTRRFLHDAGFGMYHARDRTSIITLRKPALQRLILQCLQERPRPSSTVHVHVLIRFFLPDVDIPKPPQSGVASASERDSRSRSSHGLPSEIRTTVASESSAVPASDTLGPVAAAPVLTEVTTPPLPTGPIPLDAGAPATFRGNPVDVGAVHDRGAPSDRYRTPTDDAQPRSAARTMFDTGTTTRSRALVRTPTRNHPFSAEVTFGAETFEEYMTQFMYAEVKFKDFRKAVIPRFDSQRQDSFVHWYKLFCSTCLQWGVWCPPYESAQEDMVHGAWWNLLPASVRQADRFMSGLIYSALILDSTFPAGTKEYSAVEGCPPNAGYHALYALLRLHHPLLHSVLSTANEIPKQRRTEQFGLYIRRLQDFMARERMATRTYTESEALDLAVRNLLPDWRAEFRRMVERDKRTGPGGALPFKLALPQLATTFVEYAAELGRDATSAIVLHSRSPGSHTVVRRIATNPAHSLGGSSSDQTFGDSEIDFVVNAITHNQAASPLCLGCHQPGHTLADCNRFVDYIVAESLAQRNPQLKAQIAASHQQFRSRLTAVTARGGRPSRSDAVRSLQLDTSTQDTVDSSLGIISAPLASPASSASLFSPPGFQQNALHMSEDDADDLDDSFPAVSIRSVTLHVDSPPVSGCAPTMPPARSPSDDDPLLLRRLAATYDGATSRSFAHADNGSMACTTHDAHLLFAYRPLARPNVRLFDAGQHAHKPVGVGFLRIPVADRGIAGGPSSVFVRTYYTPTIPGIIVSHSAIAKQLGTNGYNMSSSVDEAGFIHFPHRLRRCQDVYIRLQPTSRRGGLTFTDALLVPSPDEHLSPIPSSSVVRRLCTEHSPSARPTDFLDATDGPLPNGCGATAADRRVSSPPPRPAARVQPDSSSLSTNPPSDATPNLFPRHESPLDDAPFPRDTATEDPECLIVRSLNRSALRMLWHQRLGHLNFRRLSDMHRFVKGFPKMSLPTELDSCPICLAAKMRKAPAGTTSTMKATTCYQGLSIDFGFMVQKSRDSDRHRNLVGFNGETCYVLLTDHYSGRLFGRAFASKAPPVDWLNSWLANNAPQCTNKYVRMDGGGELGKCREIHRTFTNFGYSVELTGPDSSHQNGPGERPHQTIGDAMRAMLSGANLQPNFWPYAFYHYLRLYNFVPHGDRSSSPFEMCGAPLPNLSRLPTFGCRVYVRPTTPRSGRVVPNSRTGVFLGYSRTLKVMYYYDLESAMVKTASHARFDEGMNDLTEPPPNARLLRHLANGDAINPDTLDVPPLSLEVSDDPFERLDEHTQSIVCEHPTLGFEISECHIRRRGYVSGIVPNTSAARIRNVRRRYIGAFVVSVNGSSVFTGESVTDALRTVVASDSTSFNIVFAPDRYIPVNERRPAQPLHLTVDQLKVIHDIQHGPSYPDLDADQCGPLVVSSLNTTTHGTTAEQELGSFTRRKLRRLPNWPDWQEAEFKQLDSMAKQQMYGSPVLPPPDAIILRQHWNYAIKSDGTRKARNCCDGSPRAAPQLKLANTYSSCIEQPCMRLFFALCAQEGFVCLKVDATNAYANSPPPEQPTFVRIDDQYADWYEARFGSPIDRSMVLPVQHALQGHPESGALWEGFVNRVIARHGFSSTTHERSLYHGIFKGQRMLICRQVDDLAIGCANLDTVRELVATICNEDGIDLRDEGILTSFNGVDVEQSNRYTKISCESYIDKLLAHYGWAAAGSRDTDSRPIEPIATSTVQQMFTDYESAPIAGSVEHLDLESSSGFSYRSVLGALIYAYVVARPDIGYAVTTLARFSDRPAKIHYDALRRVARYLRMTKSWGLFYWRPKCLMSLPVGVFQPLDADPSLPVFPAPTHPTELAGYVDAAHATDLVTRRSITGLVFMICGGPIAYKSKIQSTVSTSSTEAEFIAAVHAAKIAKYLRSILSELGYSQSEPTMLYEDNAAAILMVNASRPTPRSRHIDIQHFAIQEWKARREIVLSHIPGIVNSADSLTKSLGSTLHHRHARRLMGHYGAPWSPSPA